MAGGGGGGRRLCPGKGYIDRSNENEMMEVPKHIYQPTIIWGKKKYI